MSEIETWDGKIYVRNDGSFVFSQFVFAHPHDEPFEVLPEEIDKLIEFLQENKRD